MQLDGLLKEAPRLERGYQLGDYTLLERIGMGGEGAVWSAWDNRRQRVVAIKIMAAPGGESIRAQRVSAEFERQVHLVASLDHPHILPLYEFGLSDEFTYFVMKYSCAGSMANRLMAGAMSLPNALRYTAQIASALEYLHRRGVVHRDLKPSNILLDSEERLYLADFGLAKRLIQETAPLHTGRGTGPYAPIEQHMPGILTPQSDIYSLGILIYEMLAGRLPWGGTSDLATRQFQGLQELPDLQEVNSQLPSGISDVLRTFTAFDWADRPATTKDAFNTLLQTLPIELREDAARYREPQFTYDEGELMIKDARYLLGLFLPSWKPNTEAFPASLTNLAFIHSAYARGGQEDLDRDAELSQFMLRGALTYGYRLDYWWQRVTDLRLRSKACEQTIAIENDEAVDRALTYVTADSQERIPWGTLSLSTLERLVDLATGANGWALRSHALQALELGIPQSANWQPVGISENGDTKLATLALDGSSHARAAARLIGRMHSEKAIQKLIDEEKERAEGERFVEILKEVRASAGSLPRLIPFGVRLQIFADLIREQLLEDRQGLSWSRSLIGLVVGVLASLMMLFGLLSRPDAQTRDTLLEPYPVSGVVTIVEVNDASLERFGRWDNWPRTLHAELIERLSALGAKAIVFDFIFDTVTQEDAALAEAMRRSGNVIQPVLGQGDAFHDATSSVRYQRGVLPHPDLLAASAAVGHPNILHDEDGYVRRVPTVATIEDKRHLSLSLVALQVFLDSERPAIPEPDNGVLEIIGRSIPVGPLGDMQIYYAGPPAGPETSTFRTVSYQDVLDQQVAPEFFQDKIVLIGMTATAEPDRYLTPVSGGRPMYGVEILANAIESVWSSRFITRPGDVARVIILLLLGVVTGLLCTRPWSGLIFAGGLILLYFIVASWVFELSGLMPDLLFPFMTIAASYAAVTAYRFSIEVRRRREVMQLFQSRVTPEVAQATIEAVKKGEITLGGRVQEVSVLLADIRGYRDYAEVHEPEEVMKAISALRDVFVDEVFAHEGTLAQYEADQTVAIFNAPLPQPDHGRRVLEAALAVRDRIAAYHHALPPDHPHRLLDFGYGVFTGRAIVGNMGSAQRYAYTAMGHAVAVASRLAKSADPSQIVVGGMISESVEESVFVHPLPHVPVKGEPAPVPAFSVVKRTK